MRPLLASSVVAVVLSEGRAVHLGGHPARTEQSTRHFLQPHPSLTLPSSAAPSSTPYQTRVDPFQHVERAEEEGAESGVGSVGRAR